MEGSLGVRREEEEKQEEQINLFFLVGDRGLVEKEKTFQEIVFRLAHAILIPVVAETSLLLQKSTPYLQAMFLGVCVHAYFVFFREGLSV